MGRSFQLLDERWIPVESLEGAFSEVGLLEAFERAADLRRIVHASPLVTVALYRLLFAIFHRAAPVANDNEWGDLWDSATAHKDAGSYLERWRHRFDLFSETEPFWQVPDLSDELETMSWAKLAAELNDNNNKVLFDHTRTKQDRPLATPAQVARLLVACQVMSVGAGNSPTGFNLNAVLATSLVVIPEGANLRDTLLANARVGKSKGDAPVWEQPVPRAADILEGNSQKPARTYPYVGLARRLTWLTRAIKIVPPGSSEFVESVIFGAGRRPAVPDGDRDPWVAYRVSKEGKWVPQRLDPTRAIWRDLQAIAIRTDDDKRAVAPVLASLGAIREGDRPFPDSWSLLLGGQAADKAKLEGWGQERWQLPDSALRNPRVREALSLGTASAEEGGHQLGKILLALARDVLAPDPQTNPDLAAVRMLASGFPALKTYWSRLEVAFSHFLHRLGEANGDSDLIEGSALKNWYSDTALAVKAATDATYGVMGKDARALRAWARNSPKLELLASKYRRMAREAEGSKG